MLLQAGRLSDPRARFIRPSAQAAEHGCLIASNGGPFNADGSCVGVVVRDNHLVCGITSFGGVGFGDTDHPFKQWVIGTINNASQLDLLNLHNFVTGFDWLVYEGKNVAGYHNNTTGARESARTAIGVDWDGKLMLTVADGCEKWHVYVFFLCCT
jgi:exopolysaccharide biosynthesis protein